MTVVAAYFCYDFHCSRMGVQHAHSGFELSKVGFLLENISYYPLRLRCMASRAAFSLPSIL